MDITMVDLAEQPTAVIRETVAVGALPEFFGRAFSTVGAALQSADVPVSGPPFAHYLGMPTATIDVEAGFPIAAALPTGTGVQGSSLPPCRAARAVHLGSYETIGTTYEAITERIRSAGLSPAEDMWEFYLTEPSADPADQETLVVIPVQP